MHFVVFAAGADLSFRFSNCGSDWKTGTFEKGIASVELDVVRSGLVLDCLGCRVETESGPTWQINRDDMSAIDVLNVCRAICAGRTYTSHFDLTAMVTRAVCEEMGYTEKRRIEAVSAEVVRSFFSNEKSSKEKP